MSVRLLPSHPILRAIGARSMLPALMLTLALAPAIAAQPTTAAQRAAKLAAQQAAQQAADAAAQVNFGAWPAVSQFLDQMVSEYGFDRPALDALMAQVRYVDSTVQLIKPGPPGKPKNWAAYRGRFVEPVRIQAGVAFWNDNADALARAEALYGVPAEVIVGIIGVETVYGRNTGNVRVLDALTTLAFDYPEAPARATRMEFFRAELTSALLYARQNGIDPLSLRGSYAGAIGLPQFMPSSILKYAVDFEGDGHIDLRNSASDAIGSVAHFLVEHGWQRDLNGPGMSLPAVYPALVSPSRAWEPLLGLGLEATVTPETLLADGVSSAASLPPGMLFGLVDLQNGADATEYWLGTHNFYAITQYNRSFFYAMSVLQLGAAVRAARTQ